MANLKGSSISLINYVREWTHENSENEESSSMHFVLKQNMPLSIHNRE